MVSDSKERLVSLKQGGRRNSTHVGVEALEHMSISRGGPRALPESLLKTATLNLQVVSGLPDAILTLTEDNPLARKCSAASIIELALFSRTLSEPPNITWPKVLA